MQWFADKDSYFSLIEIFVSYWIITQRWRDTDDQVMGHSECWSYFSTKVSRHVTCIWLAVVCRLWYYKLHILPTYCIVTCSQVNCDECVIVCRKGRSPHQSGTTRKRNIRTTAEGMPQNQTKLSVQLLVVVFQMMLSADICCVCRTKRGVVCCHLSCL